MYARIVTRPSIKPLRLSPACPIIRRIRTFILRNRLELCVQTSQHASRHLDCPTVSRSAPSSPPNTSKTCALFLLQLLLVFCDPHRCEYIVHIMYNWAAESMRSGRDAVILLLVQSASSFKILIDLNTYNSIELEHTARPASPGTLPFTADGTWTIEVNSPGVPHTLWSSAITAVGGMGGTVISEDNPGAIRDCKAVRSDSGGRLTATFQYHETGGVPATMLNASEIDAAAGACGAPVVILTRAFWPGSEWRSRVVEVLSHPSLIGVAMVSAIRTHAPASKT
jgi:hypothetical protein